MASTTYYRSAVKVVDSNFSSDQQLIGSCKITATRASSSDKDVKLTIVAKIGFQKNYSGSNDSEKYRIVVKVGSSKVDWTSPYFETLGYNDGIKGQLDDTNKTTVYNMVEVKTTKTVSWYGTDSLSISGGFQKGTTAISTAKLSSTISMPTYSSSSGGGDSGGGSTTTITQGSITSFTISPNPAIAGEKVTASIIGKAGQNNTIKGYSLVDITDSNIPTSGTVIGEKTTNSTSTTFEFNTPNKPNTTAKYVAWLRNGSGSAISYSSTFSLQIKAITPIISNAYIEPTQVNNKTGGKVRIHATTNTKTIEGQSNSFSYYKNNILVGYDYIYTDISVNSGDIITVKAYDGITGNESSSSKTITVQGYTPVEINSINIMPEILKDNTGPDLVNIIKQGSISTSGSGTVSWEYKQHSTDLNNASWQSLNIGGNSFTNLDMTRWVDKGNLYKIRAVFSGDKNTAYEESNTYRIPNTPLSPIMTEVIPKADPEHGYTVMKKDGKTYYGSGLFAIWKEQNVDDSRLEITERELIYQSRSSSSSSFSEIKVAQLKYKKVLRADGTLELYPLSTSSGFLYGGGDNLETESLQETRIGVRITDILGQTADVFWQKENFYKSESPGFGGNLVVNFDEFRPFTADPNGVFNFSSSVAQSNSQDILYYYINCWIGERKCEVEILKNIPISYQEFVSATTDAILYLDDNIKIKKQKADTLYYEVKNSYLSNLFLSNAELREVKNSLEDKFNNDFTDAVYKIFVKDDFDASSTTYNSRTVAIRFIEKPTLSHNSDIQMGINRYRNSINPFYGSKDDNSDAPVVLVPLNSLNNNDRMVNPSEGVIFKFEPARDYNGLDYKTTMRGDVVGYNIYVSRNDEPVNSNYDKLNYTLLKYYSVDELKKAKPNDSNDKYYYLEYLLTSYQESKFTVFKIEAVDSKGNKSDFIYSNTYIVPCRAQSMDFYINNVNIGKGLDNNYTVTFKTKVNDFGASVFVNNTYGYDKENQAYAFPNYERRFTVSGKQFSPKGYLILEASLDGDFNNKGTVELKKEETGGTISQTFDNYFNLSIDLASQLAGRRYPDIIETEQLITNFPTQWTDGIENKFIKKIFFKATYKIAYGFKNIDETNFDTRYLIVESVSAPYSYYEDAPTVSYRNHQVGINTKDFSANSTEGQKEVLIIQDNGSYNLVVFKGAEQKIILNLTDRSFYTLDSNDKVINEVNFGTGFINGMTIDGGSW